MTQPQSTRVDRVQGTSAGGRGQFGWLIAALVIVISMLWSPVAEANGLTAAPPMANPPAALAASTFSGSDVVPEFPQRITFRVTANGNGETITDVRLYYGHMQDPIRTQVRPTFTAGGQVNAQFVLNARERYLPPGSEIEYYWEVKDANGVRTESARQRFIYSDPRFSWRERSLGLVTLHWYNGGDAFANDVLDTAQRTLDRLKQQMNVAPDKPIHIWLYGSNAEFAAALPPNSAEWIGGQAYPGLNLIVAGVRPDGGAAREIRRMVPHELSHIVLHQATDNPYNQPPTWLDEGLAVYNQETPDSRFPPMVANAAQRNRLIPLRALNSSFPLDPNEALLSYAQSAAMVEFLITRFGTSRAAALAAIFREGVSYDEAVERSLGVTIEELDREWQASLGKNGATTGVGAWAESGGQPPFGPLGELVEDWLAQPVIDQVVGLGLVGLLAGIVGLVVVTWLVRSRRHSSPPPKRPL